MLNNCSYYVLYPLYFNIKRTKSGGRKFNKELAIDSPAYKELVRAASELQYDFKAEPDKKHPRDAESAGRVLISKKHAKKDAIASIAKFIQDERKKLKENKNKGQVQNTLNLMARRKTRKK